MRKQLLLLIFLFSQSRADKGIEQRVAVPWRGFELGVKLHANEPGVDAGGQFDNLGQLLALRQRRDHQPGLAQAIKVLHIGLVAVAVALGDHVAINAVRQRAFLHV